MRWALGGGCAYDRLRTHSRSRHLRRSGCFGISCAIAAEPEPSQICLAILILITIINLRGVQETGGVFLLPTYVFVARLLGLIAVGVSKP